MLHSTAKTMVEEVFATPAGPISALTNKGSGPLVLAIHGFLDNAASMACLGQYFADFTYVAIDLPGHGKSFHRPAGAHYHQMDYLQDLFQLIESQGWRDIVLLGHSLGGILASLYAAVFPEQIKAVACIDACGPLTLEAPTSVRQIRASIVSRANKAVLATNAKSAVLEDAVKARCALTDISAEHARTLLQRNMVSDSSGATSWRSDPRLRTKSTLRLTSAQAEQIMRKIAAPVWIGAATDSFKDLSTSYSIRKQWLGRSRLESFSGGHHFHMVRPLEVATAIRQFVEEL